MKINWTLSNKRPFKVGDKAIIDMDYKDVNLGPANLKDFQPNLNKVYEVSNVRTSTMRIGKKIPPAEQTQFLTFKELRENVGYPAYYFKHYPK